MVRLDDRGKTRHQFQNEFAMHVYKPGVHKYRCYPYNYGQAGRSSSRRRGSRRRTPDGGLAAALYGPSTVTERTGCPFADTITFAMALPGGSSPRQLSGPGTERGEPGNPDEGEQSQPCRRT